jgi:predicted pyridoxine 5'-phosphate oxidase superfamily flavin-nucleotide-binding protein
MTEVNDFYHEGMRTVQDKMDSVRLADRLREVTVHEQFTDDDRAFIESASMVFVATADAAGQPDCSYKGGAPGFIRVLDNVTLALPIYDGNGQYRTLGNIVANSAVGLLFIEFDPPRRLRINGDATIVFAADDATFVESFTGAEAVAIIRLRNAFPNCPRYVHNVASGTISEFAPAPGHEPPQPEWKSRPSFQPYLPQR